MRKTGTEAGLAERFRLARRIADDLAHELKNPLNAIVINLEVLRTRVRAGRVDVALERLDVLEEETRRLHGLLDHVLRLLRPDQPQAPDFLIAALLAEVGVLAEVLAKLARHGFELKPGPAEVRVAAQAEPLRFALLALCEAALAGPPAEGETVTLEASEAPAEVQVTLTAPASAAGRLQAALPMASTLIGEGGPPLAMALDDAACRVRLVLPRAAA